MNGRRHSPWPVPPPESERLPPISTPPARTRADRIDLVAIVATALFVACMAAVVVIRLGSYGVPL